MKAIWLVRSRQLMSRMRFLTAIVGYDPYDRSFSHRIYLIYVVIFFSVWGFAMLALIADQVVVVLLQFKGLSPIQASISITVVVLMVDTLLRGYLYARRSPFKFSDEDAMLICQTPVDRRQVALAWLLGDWIPAGLPYWAGVIMLSFACQQMAATEGMVWVDLPIYLLTGFRVASIMVPLHLAFMTSSYAFGTLRLQGDKELSNLRLIPVAIGASLLLLAKFFPTGLQIILSPMFYPLEAGFGSTSLIAGLVLAIFMASVSLIALYLVSSTLNLSRAAQESYSSHELMRSELT